MPFEFPVNKLINVGGIYDMADNITSLEREFF